MTELAANSALCQVLVGRDAERDMLRQAVEHTQQGHAQVILVGGEAGIGKSRLLREARAAATVRGFRILQGYCFQQDVACPYAPILDLLHAQVSRDAQLLATTALAPVARQLLPLLPELVTPPEPGPPLPALDPEREKRRLFAALADLFVAQAAEQPLMLVFEDVHWSDDTSLELFGYVARRCLAHPILMLMSYRSDELGPRLRHWLAQLDRERVVQEIALHPLSLEDIEAMMRSILDLDHPVRPEFLEPLYTLVEGNPFVLEEVLRSLIATGDIYYTKGRWERKPMGELHIPRSVQDAVQLRLGQVSPLGQRVLQLAAVAGRRFDFALIRRLSDLDEEALLAQFKELVAAQLVVEESADRFAFRHALTRETIYAGLLARERQSLHRTIAGMMEQLYAQTLDAHLGDLATHYFEAGEWAAALTYAQRAGVKAQALFAPQAAVEHLTHALQATVHLGAPAPAELYRARGQAFEILGNFETARADYVASLAAARGAGDRHAEWQALMDMGMLWTGRDYAQTEAFYQQAFELANELGEPRLRAHSLNRVGNWRVNVDQPIEALTYHQEALAIFEELGDLHGIADTLDLLGMASLMASDHVGCKTYYDRSVALFEELGDRQGLASSLTARTLSSTTYQVAVSVPSATTLPAATAEAERAAQLAHDIGYRAGESFAWWALILCLGPQGLYARALQAARLGVQIADEIEHRQWMSAARCVQGALYTDLFALPQAHKSLEAALQFAHDSGSVHWVRNATGHFASACIALGNYAEAQELLERAQRPDMPMQTTGQRLMWSAQAELHLARANAQKSLQISDALVNAALNRASGPAILRLSQLRGEALLALRRLAEAEAELLAGLDTATTYGARSLAWRIQLVLGKVYQAQRRPDAAAQAFAAARTLVDTLAANIPAGDLRTTFVAATDALLPRAPAPSARRAARDAFGGLTAREREVAALITQGQSNHAIADLLVVSERTIETHVSNILLKLGFMTRAQIAAWAVEKGLVEHTSGE